MTWKDVFSEEAAGARRIYPLDTVQGDKLSSDWDGKSLRRPSRCLSLHSLTKGGLQEEWRWWGEEDLCPITAGWLTALLSWAHDIA